MRLTSPCTIADLADVVGRTDPFRWAALRHQLARSQSFAIRDHDARAHVVGGFWSEPGFVEAWFTAAPSAARLMLPALRLTRLTLTDRCHSDPRPVIAIIRTVAGARIANALGFAPLEGGVWQWGKPHDRRGEQDFRRG